jgi:hypothetical protein
MTRLFMVLIMALGVPALPDFNGQVQTGRQQSAWTLLKNSDPMNDKESRTLVVFSADKRASLRIHCNDVGNYVSLITVPKEITLTDPSLLELRFDKAEVDAYMISAVKLGALIASIGGSKTDANYSIAFTGVGDPTKIGAPQVAEAGKRIVAAIRSSTRLAYRLSLAAAAEGTDGAFDVRGFTALDRKAGWGCGR